MASDRSTRVLRRYLDRLGYDVYKWDLGRNLGPRSIGHDGEILHERLHDIMDSHGEKVSIVGWSLGGAMARQLGERFPDVVRQVITLGSPLQGSPRSTSVWRVYEAATGQKINSEVIARHMEELAAPPKVPTTAIYSKADGVVPWQNCRVQGSAFAENVEVYGSHMGLGINGTVLYVIADRLGQKIEDWKPFTASGLSSTLFPANRDS
jgi:esterase/lipase